MWLKNLRNKPQIRKRYKYTGNNDKSEDRSTVAEERLTSVGLFVQEREISNRELVV